MLYQYPNLNWLGRLVALLNDLGVVDECKLSIEVDDIDTKSQLAKLVCSLH